MQKYVYVESLRREYKRKITTSARKEYSTKRSRRIAATRTTILGVFLIDTTYLAGKLAPPRLYLVVLRCQPVVTRDYLPRSSVLLVAFYAAILPKYRLIKCPLTYDLQFQDICIARAIIRHPNLFNFHAALISHFCCTTFYYKLNHTSCTKSQSYTVKGISLKSKNPSHVVARNTTRHGETT